MILYIENSKDSDKKILELINEFRKVAGYEINIQESVTFLYANDELTERENNPIHNCFKKNKIARNNSNQRHKISVLGKL